MIGVTKRGPSAVLCHVCCAQCGQRGIFWGKRTERTRTAGSSKLYLVVWAFLSHLLPMSCLCIIHIYLILVYMSRYTGGGAPVFKLLRKFCKWPIHFYLLLSLWPCRASSSELFLFKVKHSVMNMLHSYRIC